MELLLSNHPPDTSQVTVAELKSWEAGRLSLSPDKIAQARCLQQTLALQRVIVQGEVITRDGAVPAMAGGLVSGQVMELAIA